MNLNAVEAKIMTAGENHTAASWVASQRVQVIRNTEVNFDSIPFRMYEAAFLPELWVPILDDLAKLTQSGEGAIGIYWPQQRGIETSFRIDPKAKPLWGQSRTEAKTWLDHIREGKYLNRGFFQVHPQNGDWSGLPDFDRRLKDHLAYGYGAQIGAVMDQFNGEVVSLEFTRRAEQPRYDDGLIAQLSGIYAAFRQAAFFASRLHFEKARSNIDTLNDIGLPAALLSGDGHLLHVNKQFDAVDRYFGKTRSGRITLRGKDHLRQKFSESLLKSTRKSLNMSISADASVPAATLHFMPISRHAQSIFSMSGTIMIVAPVATTSGIPSAEIIISLFGLTRAEAHLALALVSGLSLRDSAANQGVTVGTARSYLHRIFTKTATSQQSELVSLLKSVPDIR